MARFLLTRLAPLALLAGILAATSCASSSPSASPARDGYPPIAGAKKVVLHVHVIGSGGYDPNNPGLQTDYMALQVRSDGAHYLAGQGDEQWFVWSTLFPKDFPTQHGWGVFAAWKSIGVGFNAEANLRLDVTDDVLRMYVRGGNPQVRRDADGHLVYGHDPQYGPYYAESYTLGPLLRGVWQTFYLHVRWSHLTDGLVELYRAVDGGAPQRLLAPRRVATLYDDRPQVRYPIQDLYHKGGASNLGTVSDVYQTPIQWGRTLTEAMTTTSRQIAEGRWFGDDRSSGRLVPASEAPVALPGRVFAPNTETPAAAGPKAGRGKSGKRQHPQRRKRPQAKRAKPAPRGIVRDSGCGACRVLVSSSSIRAIVAGGGDVRDTALWTRPVRADEPLTVSDRIRLTSRHPLDGNLAILQVRAGRGSVLYEIYVAPDRTVHLWSPPGALKKAATNRPLGVSVPDLSGPPLELSVSLTPSRSLLVRSGGGVDLKLTRLGPLSRRADKLRVGVDHYDGSSGNPLQVIHSQLSVGS